MVDFSIFRLNFLSKESVVKFLKVFGVRFEEDFSHLIEHGDELVFGECLFLLESFFLFIFVVDLCEEVVKMRKSKFIAENATIKDEHEYLRIFEKIGISFGKVRNQLIDSLDLCLLKLKLVRFHLIFF